MMIFLRMCVCVCVCGAILSINVISCTQAIKLETSDRYSVMLTWSPEGRKRSVCEPICRGERHPLVHSLLPRRVGISVRFCVLLTTSVVRDAQLYLRFCEVCFLSQRRIFIHCACNGGLYKREDSNYTCRNSKNK